ncbi:hypothetical protein A2631_00640 [Candidatus Daviesbacteria bacterium RIFCSPHIGHO2_01_FULL_44_29]|uniref:Beta-lactamase class A catalytic domain-containing protein n=1 Tax=Candidatus Daviesbacteria bacterium RIFCSPHIGHO2_02_FULL_43_12 TaxID=1797776 RepID=A0A1F5KHG1_9BACT|nr:MAG: hypothetical protein A2631_00640 [Candidatus Daviesbacteria bacterium RIFCSPHIGHO2_01_FULL_44_29]OGE39427.1 MAG: hypothetical protein A3E86_01400 [Candidatus Daviesbacteria bacterium RIFCSPHIGHO2_12_FULL_47_45]OGE40328.1 MAG: hypothetical protein A3D25_03020 [Candidatus Daviesbacteria bacterium RIFCSPHIGHO2_02_FULL_43_12]OGE69754.1 MAG: hypothetical protein A3B55_02185 [Candidatus Daviesbacteria bacterium RIFCSPLOWO2_01_FULL_43_15]
MSPHSRLGLGTLIALCLAIFLARLIHGQAIYTVFSDIPTQTQSKALQIIVNNRLKDQKGDFAIVIENIQTKEQYHFNSQKLFPSGSFYKLVLIASVYKELAKGSLTKETILSASKDYLTESFGAVDFGYENFSGPITLSLQDALNRVAQVSDNFAAIMLTDKVRELTSNQQEPLAQMAQDLGLKDTHFGQPETTALDTAHFFRLLSEGKVLSPAASQEIIDLLASSQINNRIPSLLPQIESTVGGQPKRVKVAHKTAELPGLRHDGGIVFLPNNPYIIVLMSKNVQFEDDTVELLANLSKDVYDYFAK